MDSQSAHILRMPGIPLTNLPGLIYHQQAQSNEFLLPDRDQFFDRTGSQRRNAAPVSQGYVQTP